MNRPKETQPSPDAPNIPERRSKPAIRNRFEVPRNYDSWKNPSDLGAPISPSKQDPGLIPHPLLLQAVSTTKEVAMPQITTSVQTSSSWEKVLTQPSPVLWKKI
ncbi:hypothetical protein AVEN_21423-1 [Araneus ventricosus]|uniref:Uncharacterized protein n=1 Tax=Araneus ventricosus TaxID=182803 RepID=A0A4Y2W803_ARAVE|nr:hypothetical protein AVEN_21423-1 [Araneus ventricosus]